MKNRTNQILLLLALISLALYGAIFVPCFSVLPMNPSPWQQVLILYFHSVPMFFLQLLLFRLSKRWWWHLLPFLPVFAAGFVFLYFAEWYILGWILVLWWCVAPTMGSLLAWAVSVLGKRLARKEGTP